MKTKTGMLAGLFLLVVGGSAQAALLGRVPLTPGGTDYQAYYDTELNITWLADANYLDTLGYSSRTDHTNELMGGGLVTWGAATSQIDLLNGANYLGAHNWRLPTIDTRLVDCDPADCGSNAAEREMAQLYNTMGGDTSLFAHISGGYWSGNTYTTPFNPRQKTRTYAALADCVGVSCLMLEISTQDVFGLAWPVRDGDISPVPAPGALWLFGTGLVAVAAKLRRRVGRAVE